MSDTVFLVVESAFVLSGDIVTRGQVVEVTNSEARDLLARGKARVATEADEIPQANAAEEAPVEQTPVEEAPTKAKK